jgi:antitoxin component YwqK of YwqJK toxin-antitoxin module
MKKFIIINCMMFFALTGYAQGGKEYTYDIDTFYDYAADTLRDIEKKPITGVVKDNYKSGKILYEAYYKNGKLEGLTKEYYENGKVAAEGYYKNGKLEGVVKFYYEGGAVVEFQYKGGNAVNGFCVSSTGKRTPLTNYEIIYRNEGGRITCE